MVARFAHQRDGLLEAASRRRSSIYDNVRAVISVSGPSASHIFYVNLCISATFAFLLVSWLTFFISTFSLVIYLAINYSGQLLIAGSIGLIAVLSIVETKFTNVFTRKSIY
ncbi:hypothetical protein HDE_01970 [Halotydeus destructor]|nr:hypothetical protein HDE_01970 [Halotydeus destructor]